MDESICQDGCNKKMKNNFITKEMELCRQYVSAIIAERQKQGFNSLRYPLVTVKINRYFLPEYREIIAEECNLVGYLGIKSVEYYEEEIPYEKSGEIKIKLDTSKSEWQQKIFEERTEERKKAEGRKKEQKVEKETYSDGW